MSVTILRGDVRDRLRELPEESVHVCVTSPPYYGLRSYLPDGHALKGHEIGLERTLDEYLAKMVEVFREVRRVLRSDGTLWLNIGDSYATGAGAVGNCPGGGVQGEKWAGRGYRDGSAGKHGYAGTGTLTQPNRMPQPGLKPKDLMMVPERLALALQADGWWIRSRIIWAKKSAMPESVRDRPTKSHEHIWLLSKSETYYYDQVAASEPCEGVERDQADARRARAADGNKSLPTAVNAGMRRSGNKERKPASARGVPVDTDGSTNGAVAGSIPWEGSTRNWRDVWHLGPAPFKEAHFATFPPEIPRRAIVAGTSEKGYCPHCGAPWVRLVEREFTPQQDVSAERGVRGAGEQKPLDGSDGRDGFPRGTTTTTTTGWVRPCDCPAADPVPAVVLDPFLGSGTTALVADRLQRDCIGIELNPEYAAMAERRIRGDSPLFAEIA